MLFFARVRFCTQLFYPCIRGSFSESGTIRSTIICILYYRSFLVNLLPALRPFLYFLVAERSPLNARARASEIISFDHVPLQRRERIMEKVMNERESMRVCACIMSVCAWGEKERRIITSFTRKDILACHRSRINCTIQQNKSLDSCVFIIAFTLNFNWIDL